jgi:hypothetical protein
MYKKVYKKKKERKKKRNPKNEKKNMEKYTRRKRKRGIWFLFSFLESSRFSLPAKEKISVKHMYKKLDKKNKKFPRKKGNVIPRKKK